jgi:hypothetical protein
VQINSTLKNCFVFKEGGRGGGGEGGERFKGFDIKFLILECSSL